MSGRDEGYYGPAPGDLSKGCLLPVLAFVGALVLVALVMAVLSPVMAEIGSHLPEGE